MQKLSLKALSLSLSFITALSNIVPVSAYDIDSTNNSVEKVEYQNTTDENFVNNTSIFAELASIYKVTIPKTVVLSGESKDASYFVKVEGDIAGYEQISVIPDESFNLYTKKKDPQEAFVSQDKTIWHVSDFDIDANGTIKANGITAGKWSGVFYFNINLEDGEKVAGDIIIPPDLPLDDDYRLIIEKISDAPGLYDDNFTLILPWPEIAKRIEGGETISQIVNSCPGGVYLSIPQGTSTIPTNYLPDTNIKYIYVPDTVTTIQTTSCPGSPIKGVFLPKSTKVEPGAFDNTPAGENKQVYVGGQRIIDTVININELPEREEDIKDEDALILEKGCKYQITALYNFYDDVTKQSTIKSSNPDVVKFIPDCTLEALEVGTSIISGKYFGPLGERNAYLLVKVIDTGYSKGSIPSDTHKHVVGPLQEENKVLATCTEDGHVDQVFYCSDCGKELGRRTIPIYATGHVAGEWVIVKEATENETGLKEQRCTVCNELLKSEVIEKLPNTDKHTDVKYVYKNKIEPTCTENGSQDKIAICNVCGKEVKKITEVLPATGHTKGEYKIVKNATCSEKGLKKQRCTVCNELLDSEEIPMIQHIEKSAVKENEVAVTCTKDGSYDKVTYCSVCDAEISRTVVKIPALGHDYKETVISPTHKEKGYTTHTCSRCGDTYKDSETAIVAHTYDAGKVTKETTCTEDGIKTYTCSCGDTKTEVIPKLGHDYEDTIIAPTCIANGYTKHVCNRCGDSYEDSIVSKLGHDYKEGVCTRCGDTLPELSVSASDFTGTYDGKAHSITVTSAGNTIQYSTDNTNWSNTNPTYTNAGTYTVYYKVTKTGYKTVTGSQKVTINKITPTVTAPTAKTLTYNGKAQVLINAGSTTGGTIQYKVGTGSYSTSLPTATNAGTYAVYYKVVGDTNCNDVVEKLISVTIKADYIETSLTPANRSKIGWTEATTTLKIPEYYTDNGQKYRITSIGNSAFSNCTSLTSITIPNSVTSIGNNAFNACSDLTSITIPSSVTSIGSYAFLGCSSLTSITIPNSVTSIGRAAFASCTSLISVKIPNSLRSIGNNVFSYCTSLKSITIPNSVTSIGDSAFYNCTSLKSITIPSSVTSIDDNTFTYCTSLTSIIVNDTNQYYCSVDGILFTKNMKKLVRYPQGKTDASYMISNSVTSIGNNAFANCIKLTSITIPSSVTNIGVGAFGSCSNLTSITIPNSVTSIENSVFYNCTSLTSITIPDSVTSIDDWAFSGCTKLTSITIPDSVTSIGSWAFSGCTKLTSIIFKNISGWYVTTTKNATSGTNVIVTNTSTNANNFKNTYVKYYWYKK